MGPTTPLMKHFATTIVVATVAATLGCSPADPRPALHAIFDEEWEMRVAEYPLLATSTGRHEWNHLLPSVSAADQERRAALARDFLDRLSRIERSGLDAQDRINYEIFDQQLRDGIAYYEFGAYEIPINADSGFHISFARLPSQMPFATTRDYENYIARLRAFPKYGGQQIENMRRGIGRGMTLPRVVLEGYEVTIDSHVVANPKEGVFYKPFAQFPGGVPPADQQRIRESGKAAILEAVVPAYQAFLDFMTSEYMPKSRTTIGASELPNGPEYYQQQVRHFTTLDITVDEVHQLGLKEVERIQAEMNQVIAEVGFKGDFAAFLEFLRTDPRFYAKTPEQLLKEAAYIAKKMDARLPSLFKTLPRLPYGVAAVPDHLAPKYTGGRYISAPAGGTEPGYYWVNTYALGNRPLYVLEALTLHEAVPGHHLQHAIAEELEGLPNFRRYLYLSVFGEGWGLYSERLGLEAGFYTDPYSNFGRLTYEMWRACRLVVDTGMHAKGWTRKQAMDYLAARTALSLHEIRTETDRYISWPAQALSYKMGELTIRRLRREAEQALGSQFDLREFHDLVLSNGAVPLPILEDVVRAWLQAGSPPDEDPVVPGAPAYRH